MAPLHVHTQWWTGFTHEIKLLTDKEKASLAQSFHAAAGKHMQKPGAAPDLWDLRRLFFMNDRIKDSSV